MLAEVELLPAAASPRTTVALAEMMHRQYNISYPVSGTRTALMHLREFKRTARLLADVALPVEQCPDCGADIYPADDGCEVCKEMP